ncbi:WD repeat-containing protein 88 [Oopsacas minuta]|uniref:WD repeat-containing protein 88 n=1 Tax=Oopsacas minuta TaxID=111878 RepID=A0AAV7K304_9METZ|nr:WD repeat-containing protein 88 [Oopsacas minuta]
MLSALKVSNQSLNTCHYINGERQVVLGDEEGLVGIWNFEKRGFDFSSYNHHKDSISCSRAFTSSSFLTGSWDHNVSLWDAVRGEATWTQNHDRAVLSCDGNADRNLVTTACDDTWLRGYDCRVSGKIFEFKAHDNSITCVRMSSWGEVLVSTSMDRRVRVWDLRTCKRLLNIEGHINVVSSCDISPDARLLVTASWDKSVKLWDLKAGSFRKQGATDFVKHEGCVCATHFADNNQVFVSCGYDACICVWDLPHISSKHVIMLRGHDAWVKDCCVSTDGSRLASVDSGGYMLVWDVKNKDIPMFLDHKKTLGLNLVKCELCGKEFSLSAQETETESNKLCVFCRMKTPSQALFTV